MNRLKHLATAVAVLLLSTMSTGAAAQQGYPDKPIRLIVPSPAGGGSDVMARAFAQKLAAALAVQVVVANRAGAGSS